MESLLDKKTKANLTEAIGHELYAHSLYKNLANYMQKVGFFGTREYFLSESEDELKHYQILVDYINDRGDVADIPAVQKQADKPTTLMDAFEIVYEAEYELLKFYTKIYEEAEDEMEDCVTSQFLLQFLEIQRKAVGEVKDILALLKIAGSDAGALLLADKQIKKWGK